MVTRFACAATLALALACSGTSGGRDTGPASDVPDAADLHDATPTDPGDASAVDNGREAMANARVAINEIVDSALNGGPDWVELLNPGDTAIDLSGWLLKDSVDTHVFTFPAGTSIGPGAFLVVYGQGGTTGLVATFGLGSADRARLFDPTGTLVDTIAWVAGDVPQGSSFGRCPDGHGAFFRLATPTPGAANDCSGPGDASLVPDVADATVEIPVAEIPAAEIPATEVPETIENPRVAINEVVNKATANNPDWVELLNPGSAAADLSGWVLRDSSATHAFTFPPGTSLAAGEYLVVLGKGGATGLVTTFGFGSPDQARLFDADGNLVDIAAWGATDAPMGSSWGRCPDGHGTFRQLYSPTPAGPNACL